MCLDDLSLDPDSPLSTEEIHRVCDALFDPAVSVDSRVDFLRRLHRRGETPEEIAGFVEVLLGRATPLPFPGEGCMDVCGTGGDRAGYFNVSTAAMLVAAACGVRVVKHGNRGITSKSGGADVLEALGVRIDLPPDRAAHALESVGCCFLFAPHYHPTFQAVAPVRKRIAEFGETSIFNMLGPLLNPARPSLQLAGVFDPGLLAIYVRVFELAGRRRAWAVHGTGDTPLDEISPFADTHVAAWEDGTPREFVIDPSTLALPPIDPAELAGGSSAFNAGLIAGILAGSVRHGARAMVVLNAAAALVIAGEACDLCEGMQIAGEAIDSGAARRTLDRLRAAQ